MCLGLFVCLCVCVCVSLCVCLGDMCVLCVCEFVGVYESVWVCVFVVVVRLRSVCV